MTCLEILVVTFTVLGLPNKVNAAGCSPTDTCDAKYTKLSATHTACLTGPTGINTGVSEAEKNAIVNKHNFYRSRVEDYNSQPVARNMQKMFWDEELAMVAQKWASNCNFNHDANKDRELPDRFKAGQNLAANTGTKNWITSAVDAWQQEVKDLTFGGDAAVHQGKVVGHYTQVVWATSSKVGCGYAQCPTLTNSGDPPFTNAHYYVCNYGPAGNISPNLYTPYAAGATSADKGADCQSPTASLASGLCDCNGLACHFHGQFGTTLVPNTCTCDCTISGQSFATLVQDGNNCKKNCVSPADLSGCGSGSFIEANCNVFASAQWRCPVLCELCD